MVCTFFRPFQATIICGETLYRVAIFDMVSPDLIRTLLTEQPERYRLGADFKLSIELGRQKEQELLLAVRKELQLFF